LRFFLVNWLPIFRYSDTLLEEVREGDFVYLDPPYAVNSLHIFNDYFPGTFKKNDVPRLRAAVDKLNELNIDFVISYAESDEGKYLAKGYDVERITVTRNIAGFASGRHTACELIISNCDNVKLL
jgi:DNA adenine methylase